MNRHLITLLILLAAFVLYGVGFAGLGVAFIVAGAGLELWFWVRLMSRRGGPSRSADERAPGAPTPPPAP